MRPFKAVLIGLGRIGVSYSDDPAQARSYQFSTHAQVLVAHPAFKLVAGVDVDPAARANFQDRSGIPAVASVAEVPDLQAVDIAIIATPPQARSDFLTSFPNLKAALVEKPLAVDLLAADALLKQCKQRGITVAVNLTRRYDADMRALAEGGLDRRIGRPMAVFATYGNGLVNNGIHLVDLVRMLIGEVAAAHAINDVKPFIEGPTGSELNYPFSLRIGNDLAVMVSPLHFSSYREVGIDIWGERGRLQIMHEGLTMLEAPAGNCRALTGARELRHDATTVAMTSFGKAFYQVYENMADVLFGRNSPMCSGEEALASMRVVEAVRRSAAAGGRSIALGGLI